MTRVVDYLSTYIIMASQARAWRTYLRDEDETNGEGCGAENKKRDECVSRVNVVVLGVQ